MIQSVGSVFGAAEYVLLGCAFLVSLLGTKLVYRYALRRGILDVPNERSLHESPLPSGGGMPLALVWGGTLVWLAATAELAPTEVLALAAALPIALMGWVDDRRNLSRAFRFGTQIVCATWAVVWLRGMPDVQLGAGSLNLGILGGVLSVVFLVWVTNLYNFMDGSDGLACTQGVLGGAFAAVILFLNGLGGLGLAAAVLSLGSLAFLRWNWPPAQIFLGDVGSNLLGFAFGALVLAGERRAGLGLLLVMPFLVFGVDASVTLLRRVMQGERIVDAHRTHAYQRLIERGWSHRTVAMALASMVAGLGALAVWASLDRERILIAFSVATSILVVVTVLVPHKPGQGVGEIVRE